MVPLSQEQFADLMDRVRASDEAAARELVTYFEPEIRREIRLRLTDRKMRRVLDSIDVSQSIFANFFARASVGQFDFEKPQQLLGLLATMVRNKVIDHYRKQQRTKDVTSLEFATEPVNVDPTASEVTSHKELVNEFKSRLSPNEREIAELRRDGKSWPEISAELGEAEATLRKRLSRACDRVAEDLQL